MKEGTLRIGNKGEGKHIKIPFSEPQTLEEFKDAFGDNETFLIQNAMRGVRIRIQDIFRDKVSEGLKSGKTPEALVNEVLDELQTIDITEKKERKAPVRKPVEVNLEGVDEKLPANVKALLMERLKAAGVKVAGEEPAAAAAS